MSKSKCVWHFISHKFATYITFKMTVVEAPAVTQNHMISDVTHNEKREKFCKCHREQNIFELVKGPTPAYQRLPYSFLFQTDFVFCFTNVSVK